MRRAAVLGGGIQGCCVALALARDGWRVDLYEAMPRLFAAASANQEGKIHLGTVYARDRSLATARQMIEGALGFAPAMERLTDRRIDWEPHLSDRFRCIVHRGSSLDPDGYRCYFGALQGIYEELMEEPTRTYLGRRPARLWGEDPAADGALPAEVVASFTTEEAAVEPWFVRRALLDAIARHPDIEPRTSHRILAAEPARDRLTIHAEHRGELRTTGADLVVNCLWEGRAAIDRTVGLADDGPWITRVKYGFLLADDGSLATGGSFVVAHGPFGDVVRFPAARLVYASWYPACRVALSHEGVAPEWRRALAGEHDPAVVDSVLEETRQRLDPFLPGLASLPLVRPLAGTIVGHGASDIDDLGSELHQRRDPGPRRLGSYVSMFTGKFTRAPLQAVRLAEELAAG